jgi:hypothetical protein
MKRPITLFCLCIVLSCGKTTTYSDTGKITGPNMLMCPTICCSGYYIEISSTKYLFQQLPANSGIDLTSSTYPIFVELDWKPVAGCSSPQTIEITAIKKK